MSQKVHQSTIYLGVLSTTYCSFAWYTRHLWNLPLQIKTYGEIRALQFAGHGAVTKQNGGCLHWMRGNMGNYVFIFLCQISLKLKNLSIYNPRLALYKTLKLLAKNNHMVSRNCRMLGTAWTTVACEFPWVLSILDRPSSQSLSHQSI